MSTERTEEENDKAREIIKVLSNRGVIPAQTDVDTYLRNWDAAFEILDTVKE